jgi:hypothetical protein
MGVIRSAFSEADGTVSFARVMTFIHSGFVLAWTTHSVWAAHELPNVAALGGLTSFALAPYATNKISTMFGKDQG